MLKKRGNSRKSHKIDGSKTILKFDKNFWEISFTQAITLIVGLVTGTLLVIYTDNLLLIPGMLILLPGFLAMRGNISGSLTSRIGSGLFLGFINPEKKNSRIVRGNVTASFLLAITVSLFLGLIAFGFNYWTIGVYAPEIIFIALLAGIIANSIAIPLALFFTFYFFKKGHDPDNIMGPFVTTTGDLISIVSLLIAGVIIL